MDARRKKPLSLMLRFSYGVGHMQNDLSISMWFSYLILFFQYINNFSAAMAGYAMLLGQFTDALTTPLVGYESDRTDGFKQYGKRKSWHLIGTIISMCAFPFVFMPVLGTQKSDEWAKFIYFAPLIVIYQAGWSIVQVTHMSLIPELTSESHQRIELNAIRYAFIVIANIAVYAVTWTLLGISGEGENHDLGPKDAPLFRNLALIMTGAGLIFTIIFHIGVKEVPPSKNVRKLSLQIPQNKKYEMTWKHWFKEQQFYQVIAIMATFSCFLSSSRAECLLCMTYINIIIGFLYVSARVIFNVSQVYLPLFLTSSLQLNKVYIATIPLTVYISGFLASVFMKLVTRILGFKVTFVLGTLLISGASCWLWFARKGVEWQVFVACGLLGAGSSTILVTSISMIAALIGDRTESGAYVYGAISFIDKMCVGIAVLLLQQFHPCVTATCCEACVWYYRNITAILPGTMAGLAFLTLLTLGPKTIGNLNKNTAHPDMVLEVKSDKEHPYVEKVTNKSYASYKTKNNGRGHADHMDIYYIMNTI